MKHRYLSYLYGMKLWYPKNFEPDPALLTVTGIRFDYAWKLAVAGWRRSNLTGTPF